MYFSFRKRRTERLSDTLAEMTVGDFQQTIALAVQRGIHQHLQESRMGALADAWNAAKSRQSSIVNDLNSKLTAATTAAQKVPALEKQLTEAARLNQQLTEQLESGGAKLDAADQAALVEMNGGTAAVK